MSIEAIAALAAGISNPGVSSAATASLAGSLAPVVNGHAAQFDTLVAGMQELSTQMQSNSQAIEALATGDSDGLHRVMMNLESTKLKFDMALQVRNKVLDAYQELMRMQI